MLFFCIAELAVINAAIPPWCDWWAAAQELYYPAMTKS